MFCNHCGNNLPAGSRFCNGCGNKVSGGGSHRPKRNIPPPMARPARRLVHFEEELEDVELFDEEQEYDEFEEDELEEDELEEGDDHEKVIFSISPAFYVVGIRYVVAILLSVAVTALIAVVVQNLYSQSSFLMAMGVATILMLNPIYHHIQHNRTIYTLTSVKLEIQSGVFSKISRNIPLRHIQDVTVNQTLKERMIGIGDVVIDSAVLEGTMPLRSINDPRRYADLILNELQYWN